MHCAPLAAAKYDINKYCSFWAELIDGLQLRKGNGAATYSRLTVAKVWGVAPAGNASDGQVLLSAAISEARFWGARRVSQGVWSRYYADGTEIPMANLLGYLAEDAGTQLVTPTASIRDMTQAAWIKVTMTTAKTVTGIDNVANTATQLTATGAVSTILQTKTAAATSRTYSCWMKRLTGTGTITLLHGVATIDVTALINSTTWTRVQLPSSQLNAAFGVQITTSGDEVAVDYNQFEDGIFATSEMDAAGAVRNGDQLKYQSTGQQLTTIGTAYAEIKTTFATGRFTVFGFQTQANPGIGINSALTTTCEIEDGGAATPATVTGLLDAQTGIRKRAAYWSSVSGRYGVSGDGGAPVDVAFDGAMGATNIGVGNLLLAANSINGTIRNARLWVVRLTDAEIAAL